MKTYLFQLAAVVWLFSQTGARALEPTDVDGPVTVEVDRSGEDWSVKVINGSDQKLGYEMIGKVPRGLGLELWDSESSDTGLRLHAEDLAKYLNVDGFPADLREIAPRKSQVFSLDPRSMSATDMTILAKWERAKRSGFYACKVVFGIYSSRLIHVSPKESSGNRVPPEQSELEPLESQGNELFGIQLRRMLDEKDQSLIAWSYGSSRDEYHVNYTTCSKADFERMAPWKGETPIEVPIHQLAAQAREIASGEIGDCYLESLMIDPCADDPSKRFVTFWFRDSDNSGQGDSTVSLLLNGSLIKSTRLKVTAEQYKELSEYRIPKFDKRVFAPKKK